MNTNVEDPKLKEVREEVQERKNKEDHKIEEELKELGHKAKEFLERRDEAMVKAHKEESEYIIEDTLHPDKVKKPW